MIRNVHERRFDVPAERVGGLIDRLSSDDDPLWPRDRWPAMRLDGPLAVGARGGHGPIRYSVTSYQPGRGVTFAFAPGLGLVGEHRLEVERLGGGTIVRHVLEGRTEGAMRLEWPLAFRWLHDALVEDALDRAEGLPPRRLGLWVRLLRRWAVRRGRSA